MTRYEVLDLLGDGGTATVHRARRRDRSGQIVALKISGPGGRAAADTLRTEADLLRSIDHPNVIRLLDVVDDGETVSLALQLAAGGSLDRALMARVWTEAEAIDAARELAAALAACHQAGVVHGDVATTNILLTADGSVLLADFGNRNPSTGTPGFIAPEVEAGSEPTPESDVFGAGKVIEALASSAQSHKLAAIAAIAAAPHPKNRPTAEGLAALLEQPDRALGASATPRLRTRYFAPRVAIADTPQNANVHGPAGRRLALLGPRVAVAVGAAMLVTGAVQLATRADAAHAEPRCRPLRAVAPSEAQLIEADVDGDGCPNAIIRVGAIVNIGSDRFVLGHPGDDLYVADWDCDGAATPALFRPASRTLAIFNEWPRAAGTPAEPLLQRIEGPPAAPKC